MRCLAMNEPLPSPTGWKPLKLEVEQYMHYLDDTDMTEDRKTELLEVLWLLISEIMSIEFETHPVQMAQAARKKRDLSDR